MKKIFLSVLVTFALFACNDSKNSDKKPATSEEKKEESHAMEMKSETKDFSGIQFASQKDTICGMPLTAGVSDTAVVDGKIYGFCSPECKDSFLVVIHRN
jgi:YHS domain-containing protein